MIIDVILVALFLVAAIWGAHKGGVKIIASLVSFVLAFVLAYTFASAVGDYVKETSFGAVIEQAIETRILNKVDEETQTDVTEESEITESNNTDAIGKIEEMLGNKVDEIVSDNKEALADKIIGAVFYGIGFLSTFIAVKLVLFIVFVVIELIFKLPVLNTFNKLIGCVLEVVLMLLKVWLVLGLISFIAPLDFMQSVIELINQSVIAKVLYEHNIIVNLIIGKII